MHPSKICTCAVQHAGNNGENAPHLPNINEILKSVYIFFCYVVLYATLYQKLCTKFKIYVHLVSVDILCMHKNVTLYCDMQELDPFIK